MSTYPCPKGHDSTEADYCSECGAKIQAAAVLTTPDRPAATVSSSGQSIDCPACTTPHDPIEGDFCEICGYNFATGAKGVPVKSAVQTASRPADPVAKPEVAHRPNDALPASKTGWVAVISIDPALGDPSSPPAPKLAAIALPLEKPVNLIGRTSQIRAVFPEVAIDFDDAVSQRHGLLMIADDRLIFRDIGSSNGTQINGIEATVMADLPLQDQDELTLGHWTKIQIRRSQ